MHVLEGPRREIRRIMLEGSAYWAAPAPTAEVGHQPTDYDDVRRVALGTDDRLPPELMDSTRQARSAAKGRP